MKSSAPTVNQRCLLCDADEPRPVKQFDDGVVVSACGRCGLLYTSARHPTPDGLLMNTDFEVFRALSTPIAQGRVEHFRARSFAACLRTIGQYKSSGKLLDVGCAHGFFPAYAQKHGYEVTGIEPSPAMARFGREVLGLDIRQGRLDQLDLADERFQVVSFTDSLEYFPEPRRDVKLAASLLAPGGLLFAKVPNGEYFRVRQALARRFGRDGAGAFSPSMRVAHYSLQTLRTLVESVGLEVLEIGAAPVIDSPSWAAHTGLWLEAREPFYMGLRAKAVRRAFDWAGRAESWVTGGKNDLSPSIYVLARAKDN